MKCLSDGNIHKNKDIIEYVRKNYDSVRIIHGDATNKKILMEAGISEADIIVIATSVDEVNFYILDFGAEIKSLSLPGIV